MIHNGIRASSRVPDRFLPISIHSARPADLGRILTSLLGPCWASSGMANGSHFVAQHATPGASLLSFSVDRDFLSVPYGRGGSRVVYLRTGSGGGRDMGDRASKDCRHGNAHALAAGE
jgi:hypothetical protein